jgi:hypothetical protein
MNTTICNFCCAPNSIFIVHGFIVCAVCKSTLPGDEPEDQDLFDDEMGYVQEPMYVVRDLILRN